MDKFTNRRQRESLVLVAYLAEEVPEMEKDSIFKPGIANLKRGRGMILKGLQQITETLHSNERLKFDRAARESKLTLIPRSRPGNTDVMVNYEALNNIAERAIGKDCTDCQKKNWKECQLRKDLMEAWIPPARDNCRTDCQYRQ